MIELKPIEYYLKKQKEGKLSITDKFCLSYLSMQSFNNIAKGDMVPSNKSKYAQAYQAFYITFYRTLKEIEHHEGGHDFCLSVIGEKEISQMWQNEYTIDQIKDKFPMDKMFDIMGKIEESGLLNKFKPHEKNNILNQFPNIEPQIKKVDGNVYAPVGEKEIKDGPEFDIDKEYNLNPDMVDNPYEQPGLNKTEEEDMEDLVAGLINPNMGAKGYASKKEVEAFKGSVEKKLGSTIVGAKCNAKQVLDSLRDYREGYAKYSLWSRITAACFGVPKGVASDRQQINMMKDALRKGNVPQDAIDATDSKYTKEQYDGLLSSVDLKKCNVRSANFEEFKDYADICKNLSDEMRYYMENGKYPKNRTSEKIEKTESIDLDEKSVKSDEKRPLSDEDWELMNNPMYKDYDEFSPKEYDKMAQEYERKKLEREQFKKESNQLLENLKADTSFNQTNEIKSQKVTEVIRAPEREMGVNK